MSVSLFDHKPSACPYGHKLSGGRYQVGAVSGTAYVGPGSTVTTTSGFPVTTVPFGVPTFTDSAGRQLYATNGTTAATVSVGWFLSTAA